MKKSYSFLTDVFTALGFITNLLNTFDTHALQIRTFITLPLEPIQNRGC
jgi:hypothetical protein